MKLHDITRTSRRWFFKLTGIHRMVQSAFNEGWTMAHQKEFPPIGIPICIWRNLGEAWANSDTEEAINGEGYKPKKVGHQQTKLASFIEACFNTMIGVVLAFVAQDLLFKIYGVSVSNEVNAWIVFWMTILSVIRSYVTRRIWNSEFWK